MSCLLVPTLALDVSLLDRLAVSIDYSIAKKVLVNNGMFNPAIREWWARHPDWLIHNNQHNEGVAASWNLAPRYFPKEESYLIVNDDVQFHPGSLRLICDTADREAKNHPILMLNDTNPFYCFVWTKRGVEEFGLFDENYFPGYWEDVDMRMRYNIAGVEHFYITDGCPLNHGKPKVGGTDYSAMIQGTGILNREYFMRKWGTLDDNNPVFRTPFNNPSFPCSSWQLEPELRQARFAIWKAFVALGPSLYD